VVEVEVITQEVDQMMQEILEVLAVEVVQDLEQEQMEVVVIHLL
jgi:hypothetical protein